MNSLSSHKRIPIRERIEAAGAILRRAAERTITGLRNRIGLLTDIFQPGECANYFILFDFDPA